MSNREKVDEATRDLDFENKKYRVEMTTTAGPIRLDLAPEVAPEHCRNMIGLARIGYYDNLSFHRVIDGFMIQGGCPDGTGTGGPGYRINAEFNDQPHEPGVLSMARTNDPNSAGSQFFICLAKHTGLDGQYTVFGKTADDESLKTVQTIGQVDTDSRDCPTEPVIMAKVSVIEQEK